MDQDVVPVWAGRLIDGTGLLRGALPGPVAAAQKEPRHLTNRKTPT